MIWMIAIYPIFFSDNESVWRMPECEDILLYSLGAAMHSSKIEKVLLVSNDKSVVNLGVDLKITSYFYSVKEQFIQRKMLPYGIEGAMKFIGRNENNDPIMIINFRPIIKFTVQALFI